MKITKENYTEVPTEQQLLLLALLDCVEDINNSDYQKIIYIDWQNFHNEYSPERVEPCPDFYGYYSLRLDKSGDVVGDLVTIDELDNEICVLCNFLEV